LVLNSEGGDIHAAYTLIEILRMECDQFEVLIPLWAKSAATLISLAADKIYMTPISELGPLDTQVREPGDMLFKGALDEVAAILQVRQEAFEAFDHFFALLLKRSGGMRISELLEPAGKFIANLMSPLYNQIDPAKYGKRVRQLDIGLEYAKRVLRRYKLYDDGDASSLAEKLVFQYPSHSFVINYNEAQVLNLPVELIKDDVVDKLINLSVTSLVCEMQIIGSLLNEVKSRQQNESIIQACGEAAVSIDNESVEKSENNLGGEINDDEKM